MVDPHSIHTNQENQDIGNNSNNIREATKTVHCLQQVIHRFSDHHEGISKEDAISFWRSKPTEAATNSGNGSLTTQENVSQEAQHPAATLQDMTTPMKSTTSTTHESSTHKKSIKRTLQDIVHRYAPVGLESQFEQLYCLLHPCLVVREQESNAAAFCLGHRGMGKSILVERCLQAFQDEISCQTIGASSGASVEDNKHNIGTANAHVTIPTMFRVVRVHGILIPGHDVGLVVKDMLQQLSQAALQESGDAMEQLDGNHSPQNNKNQPDPNQSSSKSTSPFTHDLEHQASKRLKRRKEERSLRLRMSTFDSNLQLLGETLKLARVDRIPILIVLDEVDAFLGGSSASDSNSQNHSSTNNTNGGSGQMEAIGGRDRQLLFYTLMERVATQNSNICLIGLTQHLALRSKLEKRIKSRMEGVSKEIFVGPCSSMSSLTSILLSHVAPQQANHKDITTPNDPSTMLNTSTDDNKENPLTVLHGQIAQLLSPPNAHEKHNDSNANSVQQRVWETLQREYRMGRSVRWFSRIFTYALSLYRGEWIRYRRRQRCKAENDPNTEKPPHFEACHLLDALVAQGAFISTVPRGSGNQINSSNKDQNSDKRKRQSHLVIMTGTTKQAPTAVDPRIQALLDLSAPQVCLILTARRLLARDAQWNGETTSPPPLTLGRLLQEYSNFRSNQQRYSRHLLWVAFQELLELNLFRPASDHCGTGPFQYEHQRNVYRSASEAEDVPLHLLLDINREVMEALQSNVLECPTALREWARKTNT